MIFNILWQTHDLEFHDKYRFLKLILNELKGKNNSTHLKPPSK